MAGLIRLKFVLSRAGRLLALLVLPGLFSQLAAQQQTIQHELSFPLRKNQYIHVQSVFPTSEGRLELAMPVWTPGSYLIRDFAGDVERFRATGPNGNVLPHIKIAKNRWQLETGQAESVSVEYDVWAGELNVSTSWVESEFALVNGAGVFLYDESSKQLPQQLTVRLPENWKQVKTSLSKPGDKDVYQARDFDDLVDSPVLAGNPLEYSFEVKGHPFALVLPAENELWDADKAIADLSQLIESHIEFWKINPLEKKYLFLNLFSGPWGGLEHDHSTVLMSGPWAMREKKSYTRWLGLASHEFFHVWNVRRLRPEALVAYDYEREVYSRELWLAEGLSSYYDDLLLFRSGLLDVAEYFELLAGEIRNYEAMPGRAVRSAELASFDTWIKHYKPDENSVNSTVSYYRKGALIGFVSDMEIRRATDNRSSLDSVMRLMYSRYGPDGSVKRGYPPGAFEDLVEEIAGREVRDRVESMLRATEDPAVDDALAWFGLSLNRSYDEAKARNNGTAPGTGFGISWTTSGSRLLVEQVIHGYSGAAAGVLPGDEVLAINGFRMDSSNYTALVNRFRPEETVVLTLARHGQLLELPVQVQIEIPESYLIYPEKRISRRQKSRLEAWLGRDLVFSD